MISTTALIFLILTWSCLPLIFLSVYRLNLPLRKRKSEEDNSDESKYFTPVSVIIICESSSDSFGNLLHRVLNQKDVSQFEVIVCINGEKDPEGDVVRYYQNSHSNLFLTFIPDGTKNLSRRKLAINLGIKASKNDILIILNNESIVESDFWLKSVMEHYDESTSIVLSPVKINHLRKTLLNGIREIDFCLTTLTWIVAALRGKAFRGSTYNLSYKKDLFFENRGFSGALNLHFGEDDIFINQISRKDNTRVNLKKEGIVGINVKNEKVMEDLATRRLFTTRNLGKKSRCLTSLLPFTLWLNIFFVTLTIIFFSGNLFAIIGATLSFILATIMTIMMLQQALSFFNSRFNYLTLLTGILYRPVLSVMRRKRMSKERDSNYTWTKL